jgi:uncharacterized surface protein with fasciclin (FAS1) repeats
MNQNNNKGVWIGLVAIIVVIALGLWWISANQSVNSSTNTATTTAATSTTSSTTTGGVTVTQRNDSVKAIVASLSGATEFQSIFNSTGVAAMIGTGSAKQYTIFVPTDGAFSQLKKGTLSSMTAAQLKRLVEYHVVSGRAIEGSAEMAGQIQALSGDPLNFSNTNNISMVDSAILVSEYKGTNGVVYVINNVLIPPQKLTQ